MIELLKFIHDLITMYLYIVIATVVLSWLVAFNVVNPRNEFVGTLGRALSALTEPLLRPIRRMMPNLGGIDISPAILGLACIFVQSVIIPNIAKYLS